MDERNKALRRYWAQNPQNDLLRALRAADVVVVGRCRDCKYQSKTASECDLLGYTIGADDQFCSESEAKVADG
jgi:3-methyladenine DNA glycosylase AlkD